MPESPPYLTDLVLFASESLSFVSLLIDEVETSDAPFLNIKVIVANVARGEIPLHFEDTQLQDAALVVALSLSTDGDIVHVRDDLHFTTCTAAYILGDEHAHCGALIAASNTAPAFAAELTAVVKCRRGGTKKSKVLLNLVEHRVYVVIAVWLAGSIHYILGSRDNMEPVNERGLHRSAVGKRKCED